MRTIFAIEIGPNYIERNPIMAIPDYQTIMLPLLRFLGDGVEHAKREAVESLAEKFKLTEEQRKELLPSGKQPLF